MDAVIPQEVMDVMEEDQYDDHEQWLYSILCKADMARRDGYFTKDEFQTIQSEFGIEWR